MENRAVHVVPSGDVKIALSPTAIKPFPVQITLFKLDVLEEVDVHITPSGEVATSLLVVVMFPFTV